MKIHNAVCWLLLSVTTPAWAADIPVPVATDSRIKTFVYSENDVFDLVTHYGYQSNIEFGKEEEIQTISVGDRVGWQVVPAGRRLFIRALTTNARTNMTVVTNKHAYQFDLSSVPTPIAPNEELVYVVRFFYPDDKKNQLPPVAYSDEVRTGSISGSVGAGMPTGGMIYNYNYTFTGDDRIAPVKLFDDGHSTYFKFRSGVMPRIATLGSGGREVPLSPHSVGDYWVVDTVGAKFTVRESDALVCAYNEKWSRP
jgi:type IV secretion system protein VirB9